MIIEGKVGPIAVADGTFNTLRTDKAGALLVASGHGDYTETSIRLRSLKLHEVNPFGY